MTNTINTIKSILGQLRASPEMAFQLSDSADLVNDIELDSLELLQFLLEIEANLDIKIDFESLEYSHLNSISILATFLDTLPSRRTGKNLA